eukprot:1143456-Pelagomonas_calceolata.AAC.12
MKGARRRTRKYNFCPYKFLYRKIGLLSKLTASMTDCTPTATQCCRGWKLDCLNDRLPTDLQNMKWHSKLLNLLRIVAQSVFWQGKQGLWAGRKCIRGVPPQPWLRHC